MYINSNQNIRNFQVLKEGREDSIGTAILQILYGGKESLPLPLSHLLADTTIPLQIIIVKVLELPKLG